MSDDPIRATEASAAPKTATADVDSALTVRDLVSGYVDEPVLRGVSIDVPHGKIVTVIGPNGSGKSTLLKTIVGILRTREGSVTLLDRGGQPRDLKGKKPHQVAELGLGFVPQISNVFTDLSIRENLEIGGFPVRGGEEQRIQAVLEHFPMLQGRLGERAGTLSGGQRQMLAVARALMSEPHVLVLDEPSAGLAPTVVDDVFDQVRSINATGITVLIVEQKARQCLAFSDYGYVLDMGRNRYEGAGQDLLRDPEVVDLYLGTRGRLRRKREERNENGDAAHPGDGQGPPGDGQATDEDGRGTDQDRRGTDEDGQAR